MWLVISLVISLFIVLLGALFETSVGHAVDSPECFDCGIDPLGSCRVPFALHFFLIAVVFVVFDAEMLLALPLIFTPLSSNYWLVWGVFLTLLFGGLVFEFFIRSIDWKE